MSPKTDTEKPATKKPAAPKAASTKSEAPVSDSAVAETRGFRKTREGIVISDKMNKTVVVVVEDRVKHPLYGKVIRRTRSLKAHDEENSCGIGDRVILMETRPLSATKRWRVKEIVERAK